MSDQEEEASRDEVHPSFTQTLSVTARDSSRYPSCCSTEQRALNSGSAWVCDIVGTDVAGQRKCDP